MNIESQPHNPAMEKSRHPDSSLLPLKKPRSPVRTAISPIWPLTKPITDIKLIFYLLPFLWVLGLEQVIPFIIIFVAGAKLFLTRKNIRVPFSMRLALIFIFMQLLSATSIDRSSNYVVFAKYFLTYIAGWLLAIILINSIHNIADVRKLIKSIVFMSGWAVMIGILFEIRILPAEFPSIAGSFLPGALKNSEFVRERILLRQIGITGEVFGPFILNRISSVYLYSTGLALASVITIPLIYYYFRTSRRILRLLLAFLLVLAIVVFLLALARTSILALIFAIAMMTGVATIVRFPKLVKPALIIFSLGIIAGLIVISLPALKTLYQLIFVNLRAGSLISRFNLYVVTFQSLAEKPLLGWGTPRAFEIVTLAPAGTHSEYLFVAYSYGLVGLILYLLFLMILWRDLYNNYNYARLYLSRGERFFYAIVGVSLIGIVINSFTDGINFDLTIALLCWTIFGFTAVRLTPLHPRSGLPDGKVI